MKSCEGIGRLVLTPRFGWGNISDCQRNSGSIFKTSTISEWHKLGALVKRSSRERLNATLHWFVARLSPLCRHDAEDGSSRDRPPPLSCPRPQPYQKAYQIPANIPVFSRY